MKALVKWSHNQGVIPRYAIFVIDLKVFSLSVACVEQVFQKWIKPKFVYGINQLKYGLRSSEELLLNQPKDTMTQEILKFNGRACSIKLKKGYFIKDTLVLENTTSDTILWRNNILLLL